MNNRLSLTTKVVRGLYVGGSWRANPPDKCWDVVLTLCAADEVTGSPPARFRADFPLFDAPFVDRAAVEMLRGVTVEAVRSGAKTLVRCRLGVNRSALVVALATVDLTGEVPADVLARLRRNRSINVLNNPVFERYVLQSNPYTTQRDSPNPANPKQA